MNPDLSSLSPVRLASGVEMQQRWPASIHTEEHNQKCNEAPRLVEITPSTGNQGTVVTVVLQSLPQLVPVKLAFNSLIVDTKQMQAHGITSLVAVVPPFQQTHSTTSNVPISVCILDADSVTETWPVAEFLYEFETKNSTSSSTPTLTSNSTVSTTALTEQNINNNSHSLEYAAVNKRPEVQYHQPREENFLGGSTSNAYGSFYQQPINNYNNLNNQQMSQYYPYASNAYSYNKYSPYRSNSLQARPDQQVGSVEYPSSNAINLLTTPTSTSFTGMLANLDQNEIQQQQNAPLNYASNTQQQQHQQHQVRHRHSNTSAYSSSKSSVHIPPISVANYQPYPGLISRANLRIMGNLDSMSKNWASEEWESRRRLVQFWRKQNGNEIHCTFDPVAQSDRITNNNGQIVVSCIYWAEHNDCFITSVDCIHLLESLMDIRFSVEERNRVRRNLEGFRPLTVSKCKAESANFFKLIMGFPNPKPRNIEKDVKVFPWKTLPYALKKIVTKYTASSYKSAQSIGGNNQQQRKKSTNIASVNIATANVPKPSTATPNASSYFNSFGGDSNITNFYQNPQATLYQPQAQFNSYQQSHEAAIPATPMYHSAAPASAYSSPYNQHQNNPSNNNSISSKSSPSSQYAAYDNSNNGTVTSNTSL